MVLPAALFPDPDRPSKTRRTSGVDDARDGDEGGVEDWDMGEGEAAKVCVEYEEKEKTGE